MIDDKVWFGVWIAYSVLAAVTTLAVLVGGGEWTPWLLIAVNGVIICHLYWRIIHEYVRVFIVEPSRSEQGSHTATDDELAQWDNAISDAFIRTGLNYEQAREACRAFAGATCPDCGNELNTGWAWCEECAEWKAV